ncbi:MAG: hypothetical protein Q9200_004157 [Gallowayella weberi]
MAHFSNKQQLDLKHRIAGPHGEKAASPIAEIIKCRACTGGPKVEMKCVIVRYSFRTVFSLSFHSNSCCMAESTPEPQFQRCGVPKGLIAFGKAQRKDPDNARCLICVNEQVSEPWAHVARKADSSDDDSDDDSTTNTYTYSASNPYGSEINSATSALKQINLREHDQAWSEIAEKKQGTVTAAERDLLVSESGDWTVKGKGKGKENAAVHYTGYDSHGEAHDRYQAPSVTSSDRSLEIVTDRPERSGFARPRRAKGNSKWAKPLKGAPSSRPLDMLEKLKAYTGRTVSYSDHEPDSAEEEMAISS